MANKIAPSMFQSGPKDALATVDVYEVKDNLPKNTLLQTFNNISESALTELRNNPNLINDVNSLLKKTAYSQLTKAEVLDQMADKMGPLKPYFKELQGPVTNYLVNGYNSDPKALLSKGDIRVAIGENLQYLTGKSPEEVESLMALAGGLTGDADKYELINLTLEAMSYNAVISTAIDLDMIDMMTDLFSTMSDDTVKEKVLSDNLERAVRSGNIDTVIRIVTTLGYHKSRARMPSLITDCLRYYKHRPSLSKSNYPAKVTEITAMFTAVDPDWFNYERVDGVATKLGPFTRASDEALQLFATIPTYWIEVAIAIQYPSRSPLYIARSMYNRIGL